jgi:hypothetical protein
VSPQASTVTRPPTRGRDVKVGDDLWFLGAAHRITRIEPYKGVNAPLWDGQARTAYADSHAGMYHAAWGITLDPDGRYDITPTSPQEN